MARHSEHPSPAQIRLAQRQGYRIDERARARWALVLIAWILLEWFASHLDDFRATWRLAIDSGSLGHFDASLSWAAWSYPLLLASAVALSARSWRPSSIASSDGPMIALPWPTELRIGALAVAAMIAGLLTLWEGAIRVVDADPDLVRRFWIVAGRRTALLAVVASYVGAHLRQRALHRKWERVAADLDTSSSGRV